MFNRFDLGLKCLVECRRRIGSNSYNKDKFDCARHGGISVPISNIMKSVARFAPILCIIIGVLLSPVSSLAESALPSPALVDLDYGELVRTRDAFKNGDDTVKAAQAKLFRQADAALLEAPNSVMEKEAVPLSGDKHDFYAIGQQGWPNPDTSNGMPWVRRDGRPNPAALSGQYDKARYNETLQKIHVFTLAWFFSGDEKYAAKAAELLRVWFVNPETRMNPHFKYAAALPGVHGGMYLGIIEGVVLIKMCDDAKLLALSQSWASADTAALQSWFSDYTKWLLTSEFGKEEAEMTNNHGAWYSAQVATFSLFTGDRDQIVSILKLARRQIGSQIAADGSFPRELTRVRSYMYSVFALRAFTALARCAEQAGEDLWHYKADNGRSLELVFTYLAPYLREEKLWDYSHEDKLWFDAKKPERGLAKMSLSLYRHAAMAYKKAELIRTVDFLEKL